MLGAPSQCGEEVKMGENTDIVSKCQDETKKNRWGRWRMEKWWFKTARPVKFKTATGGTIGVQKMEKYRL